MEKMLDGDLDAMVLLAEYLYEDKTYESIATSKQYLETASQYGHAYASYLLAKRNRMVLSPPADKFWMDNREQNYKYYLTLSEEQGNRSALYYLGVWYENGQEGFKKNIDKAIEFYTLSAQQNYPAAMSKLADKLEKGLGITQDISRAFDYFQQASKFRIPEAMFRLGKMLLEGHGIVQDIDLATMWIKKAAFYGNRDAKKIKKSFK